MNNTKWYQLEPVDAWFFRDGRPSNREEDQSDLVSLFPPHASTVVGALRAALARKNGWDGKGDWCETIKRVLGDGFDNLGKLSFLGPFLMKENEKKENELLFPAPGHLLGEESFDEKEKKKVFSPKAFLKPSDEPILCDLGKIHLPVSAADHSSDEKPLKPAEGYFVTTAGMDKILNGEHPCSKELVHQDELFQWEARVGIAREGIAHVKGKDEKSDTKGSLYNPKYIRLAKGVSLVMGIDGLPDDWTELPSYFPLGGESRLASCETIEEPTFPKAETDDCDRLILITPAQFSNEKWYGAVPGEEASNLNAESTAEFAGKIKTALFDRPINIGGWDSRKKKPLPMEPYVPAGAVWWFEESFQLPSDSQPFRSLGNKTAYGYGIALPAKAITK